MVAARLAAIAALYREGLTWVRVHRGGYLALADGVGQGVLIALVPTWEAGHLAAPEPFQTSCGQDRVIVSVRALSFTPRWAGIVLFHDLSHAYDFTSGLEPCQPNRQQFLAGEARAFQAEIELVDRLAEGRLRRALDRFVTEAGISAEEIRADPSALGSRLDAATFGAGGLPPGSQAEMNLRDAFYLAAALFRLREDEHGGPGDPTERYLADIDSLYAQAAVQLPGHG